MAWPMIAAAALSAAETVGNNMMSEWHADKAQERQKELANIQFNHNMALQRSAMGNQVQSAKMAGLNPAMFNGHMASAQSVSQGSAPKAENVESSPSDILLMAQARNLEADTDKKRSEIRNVDEDTDLKFAQKLFTGANQDKVAAETTTIRNTNDAFSSQNRSIGQFGQAMAQKWQSSDWYNNLAPDTRATIDGIADGSLRLDVGSMRALSDAVAAQKNLSDADAALVRNAFDNAIIESQFSNDDVFEAIVKDPKVRQNLTESQIEKIKSEVDRLKYKYKEVIDAELKHVRAQTTEAKARAALESAERRLRDLDYKKLNLDPDVRRYEGDIKGYLGSMAQHTLDAAISAAPSIAGSYLTGRIAGKAAGNAAGNAAGKAVDKASELGRTYKAGRDFDDYLYPYDRSRNPYMRPGLGRQMWDLYNSYNNSSSNPFPRSSK